ILFLVRVLDAGILSSLDALRLAASRVAHHVARFILRRPLSVCSSNLLPGDQHCHLMLAIWYFPGVLHRVMNRLINFHLSLIVWGYYERPFWLLHILVR